MTVLTMIELLTVLTLSFDRISLKFRFSYLLSGSSIVLWTYDCTNVVLVFPCSHFQIEYRCIEDGVERHLSFLSFRIISLTG